MKNIILAKTDFESIKEMRRKYLLSLPYSQELFLEYKIRSAEYFIIKIGETAGYLVKSADNTLLEFYIKDDFLINCESIFSEVVKAAEIENVFCKSFDSILLKCCLKNYKNHKVIGHLFRDFKGIIERDIQFKGRVANESDSEKLWQINDTFFENIEELNYLIKHQSLIIYEDLDTIFGCGLIHRVNEVYNNYDIGMLVNPEYRRKGYALKIIKDLVRRSTEKGWNPVCGCSEENIASRKTLEKAGFLSKHCMIEFSK